MPSKVYYEKEFIDKANPYYKVKTKLTNPNENTFSRIKLQMEKNGNSLPYNLENSSRTLVGLRESVSTKACSIKYHQYWGIRIEFHILITTKCKTVP